MPSGTSETAIPKSSRSVERVRIWNDVACLAKRLEGLGPARDSAWYRPSRCPQARHSYPRRGTTARYLRENWYARVDSNHRPFAPEANGEYLCSCVFSGKLSEISGDSGTFGAICTQIAHKLRAATEGQSSEHLDSAEGRLRAARLESRRRRQDLAGTTLYKFPAWV